MYLVLIETVDKAHPDSDDGDRKWAVVAHTRFGIRNPFPTRETAEAFVHSNAKPVGDQFLVVKVCGW